jgi:hypothetical protein
MDAAGRIRRVHPAFVDKQRMLAKATEEALRIITDESNRGER